MGTSTARTRKGGLHAWYHALDPQPVMQADHGVQPHDDEEKRLHQRAGWPQQPELDRVGGVHAVEGAEPAGRHDVRHTKERDPEPERNLSSLPGRQAPRAAVDELPERQADVHGSGSIEEK